MHPISIVRQILYSQWHLNGRLPVNERQQREGGVTQYKKITIKIINSPRSYLSEYKLHCEVKMAGGSLLLNKIS